MNTKIAVVALAGLLCVAPRFAAGTPVLLTKWGSFGTGQGEFDRPLGMSLDASGNVYVVDSGNQRIQKFSGDGVYLGQFGGSGTGNGRFASLTDCAVDAVGTIYVSDTGNQLIQVFDSSLHFARQWSCPTQHIALDPTGQFLYVSGSDSLIKYRTVDGGRLASWQYTEIYNDSYGFAVGPSGDVYIAYVRGDFVRKFAPSGDLIKEWGGFGQSNGEFIGAKGLGVDATVNVYVADGQHRIQKFSSDGVFLEAWGDDTILTSELKEVCVDGNGNVFVLDQDRPAVLKFGEPTTATRPASWGELKARYR